MTLLPTLNTSAIPIDEDEISRQHDRELLAEEEWNKKPWSTPRVVPIIGLTLVYAPGFGSG